MDSVFSVSLNPKRDKREKDKKVRDWVQKKYLDAQMFVKDYVSKMEEDITAQGGFNINLLNEAFKFKNYNLFIWIVFFCDIKVQMLEYGKQCFVSNSELIIDNHGIVANKILSEIFKDFVRDFFYDYFLSESPSSAASSTLAQTNVFNLGYPGRDLYPTPFLMFDDMIRNLPKRFGDQLSTNKFYKGRHETNVSELYLHKVSEWPRLRIQQKSIIEGQREIEPEDEEGVREEPVFSSSTIRRNIHIEAEKIAEKMYSIMYNKSSQPINIVSALRHPSLNRSIRTDVDNFIYSLASNKSEIVFIIEEFLSYSRLIQLNEHYQGVIDWDRRTELNDYEYAGNEKKSISTSWKFNDIITGPQEELNKKTENLKERLNTYEYNERMLNNLSEITRSSVTRQHNSMFPNSTISLGGSLKTKRQRKHRQRKQKSKRNKKQALPRQK